MLEASSRAPWKSDAREAYQLVEHEGLSDECLPITVGETSSCQVKHHSHPTIDSWPTSTTRCDVSRWSYAVKPVYFKDAVNGHKHYVLDGNDVLPYKVEEKGKNSGAFSFVRVVSFAGGHCHSDRLLTWRVNLKGEPQKLTIKKLDRASKLTNFNRELVSLLSYKHHGDQHLIPLLVTYEKMEEDELQCGFIFPCARGDLPDFWKHNSENRRSYGPWMLRQVFHLARALLRLHDDQQYKTDAGEKLCARHGDIKPHNILCFKDQGAESERLVLADFGLGRLHTKASRSTSPYLGGAAGYRQLRAVPESGLRHGVMSKAADVFSLGRTYLEFITWLLELIRDRMLEPDRGTRIKMEELVPKLRELAEAAGEWSAQEISLTHLVQTGETVGGARK